MDAHKDARQVPNLLVNIAHSNKILDLFRFDQHRQLEVFSQHYGSGDTWCLSTS